MTLGLVIGSEGQDGRLLFERLRRRGDRVVGIGRAGVRATFDLTMPAVDVTDEAAVHTLLADLRPDEIYYLAAHHHASHQTREPAARLYRLSHAVHVDGLLNVLTAVSRVAPATRLFYAASSHVFGRPTASPQNEATPLAPENIYAITKSAAIQLCRHFRRDAGVHVSAGILYNHESSLRRPEFVSQRIVRGAVDIAQGRADRLTLGDLSATVDWGAAADTVDAMTRILSTDPGEYVVATGVPHRVEDFAREAFAAAGLDWKRYVVADATCPPPAVPLVGDASKLRAATGWTPTVSFTEMVHALVRHRLTESEHG